MKTCLSQISSLLAASAFTFISSAEETPLVIVPVAPYEYLFEKVGGDHIEVRSLVGEGDDAHSYNPTPKQVAEMTTATLLCSGELGFESNYFVKVGDGKDAPLPVDLLEGLDLLEGHCDHPSHKDGADPDEHHDHDHEALNDPHIWLSPKILSNRADFVAGVLKKILPPEASPEIETNAAAFKQELAEVDVELSQSLAPLKGKRFYVYHGAFAYFARDYGLEQVAIELGNRKPTPKQLAGIVEKATEDGIQLVFVQPQFDQSSAKALAEAIDGKVATLDPLKKDVISNLRMIAKSVGD